VVSVVARGLMTDNNVYIKLSRQQLGVEETVFFCPRNQLVLHITNAAQ
jgi:hypothetical protein